LTPLVELRVNHEKGPGSFRGCCGGGAGAVLLLFTGGGPHGTEGRLLDRP
jgi:hypothetical protein